MRLDLTRLHTVSNSRPDTYSSEGFHNPQNSEMDSRIFNVAVFCCCWSLLYSAILRSRADSLRSRVILHQWLAFYSAFLNIHWSGVLTALTLLVPYETAAILARSVYTILPCTMSLHKKSHTPDACMFSCNCHLHFWQNDQDLLRATAVTRGWNGYRNKGQHRKLTLEKKILPPLLPGLESGTFRSRVRRSNHWATPAG